MTTGTWMDEHCIGVRWLGSATGWRAWRLSMESLRLSYVFDQLSLTGRRGHKQRSTGPFAVISSTVRCRNRQQPFATSRRIAARPGSQWSCHAGWVIDCISSHRYSGMSNVPTVHPGEDGHYPVSYDQYSGSVQAPWCSSCSSSSAYKSS